MTKMATMAINSKNIFKTDSQEPDPSRRPMILKLDMKHRGMEIY